MMWERIAIIMYVRSTRICIDKDALRATTDHKTFTDIF